MSGSKLAVVALVAFALGLAGGGRIWAICQSSLLEPAGLVEVVPAAVTVAKAAAAGGAVWGGAGISASAGASEPTPAASHYTSARAESHRVRRLPGWGRVKQRLYSGYVNVDKKAGRELFYVYVECERHPSKAPVLLWLTGGPGCSSVGSAFIGEHGPFFPVPGSTKKLMHNKYSFNSFANVIYLDAPAFVGFSYSKDERDRTVGDKRTAKDNLEFIRGWLELFPHLKGNPFWIAGESYAGHYIPSLAWEILNFNNGTRHHSDRINLQGFLAGNPSTDSDYDNQGRLDYWWSHALISEDIRREIQDSCNFTNVLIAPGENVHVHAESKSCKKAIEAAIHEMGPVDIQDIFADKCQKKIKGAGWGWRRLLSQLAPGEGGSEGADLAARKGGKHSTGERHLDPCISQEGEAYLKRRDVQDALQANTSGQLGWEYSGCTDLDSELMYSKEDQMHSQLHLYRKIMEAAPKLSVLIYTGDTDALVPVIGTRRWTYDLGLKLGKKQKVRWRYWKDPAGQVGGFLEEYTHFTYVTIRGASHMAPYSQQARTDYIYRTWLAQKDIL